MKTITLQTTIGPDGKVHLEIPSDLAPGPVEVRVTIQPIPTEPNSPRGGASTGSEVVNSLDVPTREDDLATRSKTCRGLFLGRLPEDYDIDAAVDEVNAQWKSKLDDLKLEP